MANKTMQERLMSSLDTGAKSDLFRELPSSEEAMAAILLTDLEDKSKASYILRMEKSSFLQIKKERRKSASGH